MIRYSRISSFRSRSLTEFGGRVTPSDRALSDRELAIKRTLQHFGVYPHEPLLKELQKVTETGPARGNRRKLNEHQVAEIRMKAGLGASFRELADMFRVHPSTIGRIVKGVYHQ